MTTTPNLIKIPVIEDVRGNLGFIQNDILPFEFKRIYYLFDVPSNAFRGGHSHINQQEILIALSGSFEVTVNDEGGLPKVLSIKNLIVINRMTNIYKLNKYYN